MNVILPSHSHVMFRDFDNITDVIGLLQAHGIDTALLRDFIHEALDSEETLNALTQELSVGHAAQPYNEDFMHNLKRFSILLEKAGAAGDNSVVFFPSEFERRRSMLDNVARFLALLKDDAQ